MGITPATKTTLPLAQHQRILDASRDGNPEAAAAAMRKHISTVAKVRLLS